MINIVHELRRAQGRLKKLEVLKRYEHNEDWLKYLKYMYDSSLNYYVSAPSDNTFVDEIDIEDMFDFLDQLLSHEYSGNQLRKMVYHASQIYGELFRLVLDNSLKAGVSVTSINQTYPGLIPTFDVMLAKDVEIPRYPVIGSTKYDGVRVIATITEGRVVLRTRSGKVLPIVSLEDALCQSYDGVYDGELVQSTGKQEGRTKITGQVNKCLKGTADDCTNYTYYIFDYLHHAEWALQKCQRTYGARMDSVMAGLDPSLHAKIAPMQMLRNREEVQDMYEKHIMTGYEGIMLRYHADPYVWGRSSTLIKKKAIYNTVLQCEGIQGGTGKYEGMIGALICVGHVSGKYVKVRVGSGLSDYDRAKRPQDYIGSKIEVMYNDIVSSKDGVIHSLFLPRFKRMRGDLNV